MSEWRLWRAVAVLTAALYSGLAWIWFSDLVPGAGGLTPFDGRLTGYSAEQAWTFLAALSDEARAIYLNDIRLLDTLFPICLAVTLAWPLWRLPTGPMRALALLPLGYLAADLLENARVAGLVRADLVVSPDLVAAASRMTVAKFALLIASAIALGWVYVTTRRP